MDLASLLFLYILLANDQVANLVPLFMACRVSHILSK